MQVRLILTLTPVVCVLSAIALSRVFEIFLKDDSHASAKGAKTAANAAAAEETSDAAAASADSASADAKVCEADRNVHG